MPGPADALPPLSAVIVTWNSARVIDGCLESILATTEGAEVVVVDNHSTDDTVARARAAGARVITNRRNRGLAAANNQGLVATGAEHILICNPDVVFAPGAIDHMRAVADRHHRAGWVVPRLILPDGTRQTSAGDLPGLADSLLGRQVTRHRSERRSSGGQNGGTGPSPDRAGFWWDAWAHDEEVAIGRGHEAAYLVRRAAVAEAGLQDERYVLDWEGIDWSDRFRRAGWETWLAPEAEVRHLGGDSLRQAPYRAIVSQHRGMYTYFADRMHPAWRPALAAAFATRAGVKLAGARAGLPLYRWGLGARPG